MVYDIAHTVKRLQQYQNSSFPIMSAYVSIPRTTKYFITHDMFTRLAATTISKEEQQRFVQDITNIDGYLAQFQNKNKYKSIAFFSGGNKVWEIIPMYFDVPTFIAINHSPYLEPILEHLATNKRNLVVLTDREKAKFIT